MPASHDGRRLLKTVHFGRTNPCAFRCTPTPRQWRGIATRHEKTATVRLAALRVADVFL